MRDRRELATAVVGAVLAGGVALVAGGQTWAQVTQERPAPLPPVTGALSGTDAAPLVPAAGLVLLAAAVALFAVRGAARAVVGVLVVLAGGTLSWSGVRVLTGGLDERAATVTGVGEGAVVQVDSAATWPVLAVLAGLVGVAVGAFVVVRGRSWPSMGRRYERPAGSAEVTARPAAARSDEERAQDAWKALDRGEDPTA